MRVRHLATLAAGVISLGMMASASAQTELTVIVYGGSFEEGWRKAVIEPFEKANPDIKVKIATGLTMQTVALMRRLPYCEKNSEARDEGRRRGIGRADGPQRE
jgi:ABC-type glycerol-3-phosphate transport system substrate-binding protein